MKKLQPKGTQGEISPAREAELQLLAESLTAADPRYVKDVVDFIWSKIVERKLRKVDSLPLVEKERLETLTGELYA